MKLGSQLCQHFSLCINWVKFPVVSVSKTMRPNLTCARYYAIESVHENVYWVLLSSGSLLRVHILFADTLFAIVISAATLSRDQTEAPAATIIPPLLFALGSKLPGFMAIIGLLTHHTSFQTLISSFMQAINSRRSVSQSWAAAEPADLFTL